MTGLTVVTTTLVKLGLVIKLARCTTTLGITKRTVTIPLSEDDPDHLWTWATIRKWLATARSVRSGI